MNQSRCSHRLLRVAAVVFAAAIALTSLDALASIPLATAPAGLLQEQDVEDSEASATQTPVSPIEPIGLVSPTVVVTQTNTVTATLDTADESIADPDSTGASVAQPLESSEEVAGLEETRPSNEPLSGVIVTNRTNYAVRFFLEGEVYRINPFDSTSFELPRATAVMNLYTCDAETPETQDGCYWDPYIVQSEGFYEVLDESATVGLPSLMLRDVNTPPENQVWIHNRTGVTETIVFHDIVYEISPGFVQEFSVEPGAPVIVYGRSCGRINEEESCEWSPQSLEPGAYYGMVEVSTPGGIPGSSIITVDLRPVVDSSGESVSVDPQLSCQLAVPALNIRSGPGLQYQIVGKIRRTEEGPGRVNVNGRSADDLWYTVSSDDYSTGWVTSNTDFITCTGNHDELPMAEFHGTPTAPAALPAPQDDEPAIAQPSAAANAGKAAVVEAVTEAEPTTAAEPTPISEGQSLLIVNNGFQYPIRFTIDQKYRPLDGPSEYDIDPDGSVSIIAYPGTIAFSASTAWNTLSGNADLELNESQSVTLWLRFQADPDGSGQWDLAWD